VAGQIQKSAASSACRCTTQYLGRRCELLADVMGQPVERLAAWGVARAVESALWHTSEDDRADGEADMAIAAAFGALL
jgi:streptomycin 6-kinase